MISFSTPCTFTNLRVQSFVLIDICLIPKSGITFPRHFAGGTTAPGSLPPASAHFGPHALTSQIKFPTVGSVPITPPQDVSSTQPSTLTHMSTSQLPWGHSVLFRFEHENVCCTPGSWFSRMLCRCLVLHSLDQGIMLLLMLTPTPKELSHAFLLNAFSPAGTLTTHH